MVYEITRAVEYILKEFTDAGITPELKIAPESEALGNPLVTVWGCSGSLLTQATVVPMGTARLFSRAAPGIISTAYVAFMFCTLVPACP